MKTGLHQIIVRPMVSHTVICNVILRFRGCQFGHFLPMIETILLWLQSILEKLLF